MAITVNDGRTSGRGKDLRQGPKFGEVTVFDRGVEWCTAVQATFVVVKERPPPYRQVGSVG